MLKPLLTDTAYLKEIMSRAGLQPRREMGQNFLISPEVVEATIEAARQGPPAVTELGSGIGTLTQALTGHGLHVRAIERDDQLSTLMQRVLSPQQRLLLDLVQADLRETDWSWPKPYQLIGNIPYNMSGLIIRRLTQLDPAPAQAVLLVQREVAQRLLAQPPEMSLLSLAIQLWGSGQLLLRVPRNCFWPQPGVDSALVLLTPDATSIPGRKREATLAVARHFFQERRKQMGGVLRRTFGLSNEAVQKILVPLKLSAAQRPQELTAEQWRQLAAVVPHTPFST